MLSIKSNKLAQFSVRNKQRTVASTTASISFHKEVFKTRNDDVPKFDRIPARIPQPTSYSNFSSTLVLNADYAPVSIIPLSVWNWQDTLRAVFGGKAVVVSEYDHQLVRSASINMNLPSVIALKKFYRRKEENVILPLTRRYIYIRDDFKCQYCWGTYSAKELSLDHVIPRSKGGKLTWTNIVSCCLSCNVKKGNSMPEDLPALKMRLRAQPHAPTNHEIQSKGRNVYKNLNLHPHWKDYLI